MYCLVWNKTRIYSSNKAGQWQANYIPAYARRYPFILATPGENVDNFTRLYRLRVLAVSILIKKANLLFGKDGEELDLLTQAVDFLNDYQSHVQFTGLFCQNLGKLDILEPMRANIELSGGQKHTLGGFMGASRDKLKAVKPVKLAELLRSDQLELIFAHLHSLTNLNKLVNLASTAE